MPDKIRLVVWPHPPEKDGDPHRYVLVGMLATAKPLNLKHHLNDVSEVVLDGTSHGMLGFALEELRQMKSTIRLGDATDVLCDLGDMELIPIEEEFDAHSNL